MLTLALWALLQADPPSPQTLIEQLLSDPAGADKARKALLERRELALLPLAQARLRHPDSAALTDLAFELRRSLAPAEAAPVFGKLTAIRITIDMQGAPATAVLDYLREISGINLILDPAASLREFSLTKADLPFHRLLDALLPAAGLDYDFRCGVLFVAAPERLWPEPPAKPRGPLTHGEIQTARENLAAFASDSPEKRDQAAAELRKLGPLAIPFLEEAAASKDAEVKARATSLLEDLRRSARAWGTLLASSRWRRQKLDGADAGLQRKLLTSKIDLAFEDSKPEDILEFIREFTEIRITGGRWANPLTMKVKDLALGEILELLTLPHGLDFKIEKGGIEIFAPEKK